MADRSDAWWGGTNLAQQADGWAKSGARIFVYVAGAPRPFEADAVEIESFVVRLIDRREGTTIAISKASIVAVSMQD